MLINVKIKSTRVISEWQGHLLSCLWTAKKIRFILRLRSIFDFNQNVNILGDQSCLKVQLNLVKMLQKIQASFDI